MGGKHLLWVCATNSNMQEFPKEYSCPFFSPNLTIH